MMEALSRETYARLASWTGQSFWLMVCADLGYIFGHGLGRADQAGQWSHGATYGGAGIMSLYLLMLIAGATFERAMAMVWASVAAMAVGGAAGYALYSWPMLVLSLTATVIALLLGVIWLIMAEPGP